MRILMVNPNTFSDPPCIPIGMEYAADAVRRHGHEVGLCDLWHHPSPLEELIRRLNAERYDLAGVSFRNLDTAQAARYINFLPDLRVIVRELQRREMPVVLGGTGFQAMPREIMEYTGADFGVDGPADTAFPQLVRQLEMDRDAWLSAPLEARIVNAHPVGIEPGSVPERNRGINYKAYIEKGSVAGFATQFGCPEHCLYCVESRTRYCARHPRAVVEELADLCARGINDFHLCDAEFNIDAAHCHATLDALAGAGLSMRWALYMKPAPCDDRILDGLRRTGAYLVTLSVESLAAGAAHGRYTWDDAAFVIRGCRARGIKIAVDLSVGLPDEGIGSVRRALEFFRTERPDKVNVNAFYRVYGGTPLETLLRARPDLHAHLTGDFPPGPPLFRLFYNQIPLPELKDMIGGDPLFKLEGFDHGTNYEILK